jgi:hypothetical protein
MTAEELHLIIRKHLRPARRRPISSDSPFSMEVIQCPICKAYEPAEWKDGSYFPKKPLKHKDDCYWAKKKHQALLSNEEYMRNLLEE